MAASAQDFTDFLNLFGAYQHAMDSGDADGVAACFTEDAFWGGGVHSAPEGTRGRQAIKELIQKRNATLEELHPGKPIYEYRRHHITNPWLDSHGDTAEFKTFLIGTLRRGNHFETVMTGRYYGKLVRGGEGWLFSERYCIPDAPHTAWWPPTEWE